MLHGAAVMHSETRRRSVLIIVNVCSSILPASIKARPEVAFGLQENEQTIRYKLVAFQQESWICKVYAMQDCLDCRVCVTKGRRTTCGVLLEALAHCHSQGNARLLYVPEVGASLTQTCSCVWHGNTTWTAT